MIAYYFKALSKALWMDYSFAVLDYETGQWVRKNGGTSEQFWTVCVAEQNQMPNMFDWQVYEGQGTSDRMVQDLDYQCTRSILF